MLGAGWGTVLQKTGGDTMEAAGREGSLCTPAADRDAMENV